MTPYLLILAVLLGVAPGLIAHGKGRVFILWWLYGVLLGPVALLHAILLRRRSIPSPYDRPAPPRWRSHWPAVLWAATSVAVAIVAVTVYGLLSPPRFGAPTDSRDVALSADRTPPTQQTSPQPPAPEKSARLEPTPTVRVTLRHEAPPPEEKLERAPVAPVEHLPARDSANGDSTNRDGANGNSANAEQALERTKPMEPAKPAQRPAAALTAPRQTAAPPPPAPPPSEPAVATLEPTAPATAEQARPEPPEPPAAAAAPKPGPTDVTAVGDTVQAVQLALAERGYDPGPANGRAGRQTQAAIRKFQSDRGLDPTGFIDYSLLENLRIVGPRVHAFRPPPGMTVGR